MNSTDLMIGDWVREGKDGRCLRVIQLEGIITETIMTESGFDLNEDIEPIPLTPEILEKNGFEKPIDKIPVYDYRNLKTKKWVRMQDWQRRTLVRNWCMEVDGKVRMDIDYIHELQHALRLCGLTELANNFIIE